jgi:hypothetical protein
MPMVAGGQLSWRESGGTEAGPRGSIGVATPVPRFRATSGLVKGLQQGQLKRAGDNPGKQHAGEMVPGGLGRLQRGGGAHGSRGIDPAGPW